MPRAHNLTSGERWISGIGSTVVASWGLRRGGLLGLLAIAGASALALRASSGRCALKAALEAESEPQGATISPIRRSAPVAPLRSV